MSTPYFYQPSSRSKRGAVLLIAVLVLLVAGLAAVVALNSSRQNMSSSANVVNKTAAAYGTDEILNRTLIEIRKANDWYTKTPATGRLHAAFKPDTEDVTALTNCETTYAWDSTDSTQAGVVSDSGKQICNFFGTSLDTNERQVRVSIRRDFPFYDQNTGLPMQLDLVSAIVKSKTGAVDKAQMVVATPLSARNTGGAWQYIQDPAARSYIAAKIHW